MIIIIVDTHLNEYIGKTLPCYLIKDISSFRSKRKQKDCIMKGWDRLLTEIGHC